MLRGEQPTQYRRILNADPQSTSAHTSVLVPPPTYLQREGQRKLRLHVSTRRQHDLMRPQDALGALHRSKVHVVNCPARHFLAIQPKQLSRRTAELQLQALLSLILPTAAFVLPLPREGIRQQVLQAGLSESWAAGSAGKITALERMVGRKTGLKWK